MPEVCRKLLNILRLEYFNNFGSYHPLNVFVQTQAYFLIYNALTQQIKY